MPVQKRKTKEGVRYRFDKLVRGTRLVSPTIYLTRQEAADAERTSVTLFLQGQKIPIISTSTSERVTTLLNRRLDWLKDHRGTYHFLENQKLFKRGIAFAPEWGNMRPGDITPPVVEEWAEKWAADLVARGKTRYQVNKALLAFQSAWNAPWGRRRAIREYPSNPFFLVDRFPVEHRGIFIPSETDANKILEISTGEAGLYLHLLAETGARPGEAAVLRFSDVTNTHVTLYTRKKTGGSLTPRKVPIPKELAESIRGLQLFNPDRKYLFQRPDMELPRASVWFFKIQRRACRAAGVKHFNLHCWRHYHASMLVDRMTLTQIQARLGHERATTTDRYLHEIRGV